MPNIVFDASSIVGAALKADSIPERASLLARTHETICLSLAVEIEIREVRCYGLHNDAILTNHVGFPCPFPAIPVDRENEFPAGDAKNRGKASVVNGLESTTENSSRKFANGREKRRKVGAQPARRYCTASSRRNR
jgi:hypothetical protein